MIDRSAGLDRAHALALEWLDSLAERPVPPRLDTDGIADRLRARPAGRPDRSGDRRRRARGGLRPRPDRDAGRPVLRLRHRRHPSRRARRRLAGQRVGPEHRPARAHARPLGGRGAHRGVAARPARPPGGERGRLRHRRHDGQLHLPRRRPRRGAAPRTAGTSPRRGSSARPAYASWSAPSGTTPSTWRCATSGWARRSRWPPTTRAGSRPPPSPPRSRRATGGRRSCASRPATCTPARSTRSPRPSPPPTTRARGCTSTAPSGCSPRPRRTAATSPRASRPPTRGRPTPTRPSTSPTTAASRSSATGRRCARRWACTATT